MILVSKPEDRAFFLELFREANRAPPIIFGPNDKARCKFLDALGGDALTITRFLMTVSESLKGEGGQRSEQFWEKLNERLIWCSVVILRLSYRRVTVPDIQKFIMTAATGPANFDDEVWLRGFHNESFNLAEAGIGNDVEKFDFEIARDFFLREWPVMNDRTRSSILAGVMGVLLTLNSGIIRPMCSTTTDFTPAILRQGRSIMVDMPIKEYGDSAKVVMASMKYLAQVDILKRHTKPGDPIAVIWADEAQNASNSMDSMFQAEARSHYGAVVYLTQAVSSLYGANQ